MIFQSGINVPCWMTTKECAAKTFSHYDELSLKDKTKAELLGNIKSSSVDIYVVKYKKVGEL